MRAASSVLVLLLCACGSPAARHEPPPGRVYYATSADDHLAAVDWSGKAQPPLRLPGAPAGFYPVKLGVPGPTHLSVVSVSPDGSRLLLDDGSIYDSGGDRIGSLDPHAGLIPMWADDSHLCQFTTPGYASFTGGILNGPAVLTLVTVGSGIRTLATIGQFSGNTGSDVVACSNARNVAVVSTTSPNATMLTAVRLSDGSVSSRRTYPVTTGGLGGYVLTVAPDGRYLALSQRPPVIASPVATTVIRDVTTGAVVATLGNSVVSAFSGDDQVVAAAGDDGIDLISWRDAHVVTHLPGTTAVRAYQPGGDAFLVSRLVGGLWLVSPRRLEKISGEPALDWPGGGR